jgi:dihydropyrimidinase/dihydroorotase
MAKRADVVIKNGIVVGSKGQTKGGVAVEGEKISYVGEDSGLPEANKVIDAKGNFIIPGFVEVHCHIGIGPAHKKFDDSWQEQWRTESEAAVYGGVTTVRTCVTFSEPYLPIIDKYIDWASQNSYCDFGLYPTGNASTTHIRVQKGRRLVFPTRIQGCFTGLLKNWANSGITAW